MQAISTKYHGPTNHRGARIKASCEAGSLTVGYDYSLGSEANHIRAIRALIAKLGWFHDASRGDRYGAWHVGGLGHGYVAVCTGEYSVVEAPGNVAAYLAGVRS
jgi:hypothetical protein